MNSLISTASAITNHVSQGLTSVIGAPSPEELASMSSNKVTLLNGNDFIFIFILIIVISIIF
jgi:hypothetical protein